MTKLNCLFKRKGADYIINYIISSKKKKLDERKNYN